MIRQMSGRFGDGEIAATLNRLSLRTGAGDSWNDSGFTGCAGGISCQTLRLRRRIVW